MIELRVDEVAAATGGRVVGHGEVVVGGVTTDSRRADHDELFVALRGEHGDGHDHVAEAVAAGAAAVLVERDDAVPPASVGVVVADTWRAIGELGGHVRHVVGPDVVAITGSVGKTTTKDLVRAAVAADRPTVAAHGSYNNELGVPLTLLATAADTRTLVVEVGARGRGHITSLMPWVAPDVAIVTAVAGAHLEMFGDLDRVAEAKGELVAALPPTGTAVLNTEDPRVWAMRRLTDAAVIGYGRDAAVGWRDPSVDELARQRVTVVTPWGEAELRVPLPGRHNLANALAAVAAAGALGVPLATVVEGIADASVSPWRGELVTRADGLLVLNDAYNANPTAVEAALAVLGDLRRPDGRVVAVLGHMAELGPGTAQAHADVGVVAGAAADLVVTVGETYGLGSAASAAGAEVDSVATPAAAVAALRGRVGADDVVLVKASRSAGLEQVATGLLDDTTVRDGARRPGRRPAGPDAATSPRAPAPGEGEAQ